MSARGLWGGVALGRWFGIEVRADWSLLVIFGLIVLQLGTGAWSNIHPEWSPALRWGLAAAAAICFFLTVLLHELSHAVVARRLHVDVRGIVLFLFGGMSLMRGRPQRASHELAIAAAGPVTSICIGAAALLALAATVDTAQLSSMEPQQALASLSPGQTLLAWLGPINLVLAAFNLIPGFPLDGGRLLRAALWYATGDLSRATRMATGAGRGIAVLLMATGMVMAFGVHVPLFGTGLGPGLWLLLIGWFLYAAARASWAQMIVQQELTGVRVAELMRSDLRTVDPAMTLDVIRRQYVLGTDQSTFPVVRDGHFLGLLSLEEIRTVSEDHLATTHAADVMREASELEVLGPDQDAASAFERLAVHGGRDLAVVSHGRFAGLLRRADVTRFLSMSGQPTPA